MHTAAGHRQRVKDRFRKEGLDSFDEVHALELLLFYAAPRIDTKPLARSLLDRFGSLALVLEATEAELMAVPGVGENVATYLTLITAAGRYYQMCRSERPVILDSTAHTCRIFSTAGAMKRFICCVWTQNVKFFPAERWGRVM